MLEGGCSAEVNFPIDRCWALIADVERAPQWQRTLESLVVVTRDERGRAVICDTVSDGRITKVRVRVRMSYEEPHALRWTQVQSHDLDAMNGSWTLAQLGPALTRVTYSLELDPGPIGRLARPLERVVRRAVIGHQADEFAAAIAADG
jgi:hypothetical protein